MFTWKLWSANGLINRRIFSSLLVLLIICLPIQPVHAATLSNNISALGNKSSSLQDQTNGQQQLESSAVSQAQSIQDSIDVLKSAIAQDNLVIEQHDTTIANLNLENQTLANQQKDNIETLGNYLVNQYTKGDNSYFAYVSWFVKSTSFDDLINRWSYVDSILSYYEDLRATVNADSEVIKAKQSMEKIETTKLTDEIHSKQQLINDLNVASAKQTGLVNSIPKEVLLTAQVLSRGQQNMSETQRLIAAEQVQAQLTSQSKYQALLTSQLKSDNLQKNLSTPATLNGQVGQLLSFAATFLGVPYTWGGTYPQFDCSSFVQYVYGHFGVTLKRVTWDQFDEGQSVSRDGLQVGDLVFFSTYQAGPSHVGIYIGDGIMIDSSNCGVSFDSINSQYWSSRYYGARRVIAFDKYVTKES